MAARSVDLTCSERSEYLRTFTMLQIQDLMFSFSYVTGLFFTGDVIAPLKFHEDVQWNRRMKNRETREWVMEHRLRNPPVRTTSPTGAENKRLCRQHIGMQTKINRRCVLRRLASRIYTSGYSTRRVSTGTQS